MNYPSQKAGTIATRVANVAVARILRTPLIVPLLLLTFAISCCHGAVYFDGVDDRLKSNMGSGQFASRVGTVSVWFKRDSTSSYGTICSGGLTNWIWSKGFEIYMTGPDGHIMFNAYADYFAVGSASYRALRFTTTTTRFQDTEWHHLLVSWDQDAIAEGSPWVYSDDTVTSKTVTYNRNDVDIVWDRNRMWVGSGSPNDGDWRQYPGPSGTWAENLWHGCLAELWYTNEFIDITQDANRRKFISADGSPADLGSDGSLPTGTRPQVYMSGGASVWNSGDNVGTATPLTMMGSGVTECNVALQPQSSYPPPLSPPPPPPPSPPPRYYAQLLLCRVHVITTSLSE